MYAVWNNSSIWNSRAYFSMKMPYYQCRNSRYKDETVVRLSYLYNWNPFTWHYSDVIMGTIESQITSLTIVYSIVYSDADQRKHQSSASLAFVRGIHWGPVNSPHKRPVMRKMFPFDDVIMENGFYILYVLGLNYLSVEQIADKYKNVFTVSNGNFLYQIAEQ